MKLLISSLFLTFILFSCQEIEVVEPEFESVNLESAIPVLSCEKTISLCQKRIVSKQNALVKVSQACEKSGSEGCENAVKQMQDQLRAMKISCVDAINEACN